MTSEPPRRRRLMPHRAGRTPTQKANATHYWNAGSAVGAGSRPAPHREQRCLNCDRYEGACECGQFEQEEP